MATETNGLEVTCSGLQCPLCYSTLTEPKVLSCTHTFCGRCLTTLYRCQKSVDVISCPICSHVTRIENGDVRTLATNTSVESLAGDVRFIRKFCDECPSRAAAIVTVYCRGCRMFLCERCLANHENVGAGNVHEIICTTDINRDDVSTKRYCRDHPEEEKIGICTTCDVFICFVCLSLNHRGSGHNVVEQSVIKQRIRNDILRLQERANNISETLASQSSHADAQCAKIDDMLDCSISSIERAYEESLRILTERKTRLIAECNQRRLNLTKDIDVIKEGNARTIQEMTEASEMIGKGLMAQLDTQDMAVFDSVSKDFSDMLETMQVGNSKSQRVMMRAEGMNFETAKVTLSDWKLLKTGVFNLSGNHARSMAPLPDGRMAVGYLSGGLEFFTPTGPGEMVLKDVKVRGVKVLSDGRFVIRHADNRISMYTSDLKELDIQFLTDANRNDDGGLAVDRRNFIFAGYVSEKKIQVFRPQGGKPIKEFSCNGYAPREVFTKNHSGTLVVSDGTAVTMVTLALDEEDGDGKAKTVRSITKTPHVPYPSVLYNDDVLVGWMAGQGPEQIPLRWVDFYIYSDQLLNGRSVHIELFHEDETDAKIQAPREFSTGEIAFCTKRHLFILKKM